jgi:crotonobetainyl-CoA:carnitine CoA-transferase CaiB-like acyl-CoA transferase
MIHVAYGDPNGGLNGAAAVMAALLHKRRTGEGQHVELAQVQALFPLAAPWIIEQSVTGAVRRPGSRHPIYVPSGVFRCAGDDAWIVLTLTSDSAWPHLCEVIGRKDLSAEPMFETAAGRRTIEDEIESELSRWAAQKDPEAAMREMQAAGVAAGVARAPSELLEDPHIAARGSWQTVDRAWSGEHKIFTAPFREGGAPYAIERPAPTLGQDNSYVLCEFLGLSAADVEALIETGVSGDVVPD